MSAAAKQRTTCSEDSDDDGQTWLTNAFREIHNSPNLDEDLCCVLQAFGESDSDARGVASLDPDGGVDDLDMVLQRKISTELLDEIDEDQASMFGRRFISVSNLLKDSVAGEVTTKQMLRLALNRRTAQILSTDDPVLSKRKALRIRALVDFIWSQSLLLGLKDDPTAQGNPTLLEMVEQLEMYSKASKRYHQFYPGFYHATIEGTTKDFGPVHINILRIDPGKCKMKCIDARVVDTDLSALSKKYGAIAAISGGFFLYSEPDIVLPSKRTDPVGLLCSDGHIDGPPVFERSTLHQTGSQPVAIDVIGMEGMTCKFRYQKHYFGGISTIEFGLTVGGVQGDVQCVDRSKAAVVNVGKVKKGKHRKDEVAFVIVGKQVIQVMKLGLVKVPLAGFVLIFPAVSLPAGVEFEGGDLTIEVVDYSLPHPFSNVENAIAGGPCFFSESRDNMDLQAEDFKRSAPPVTFSQDETFDRNLLPRMGVGLTAENELICVAVDGRNLDRALGLTLRGTSDLLRSLGCVTAMNLDGGSSKRMAILQTGGHKVVCLSTTEIKAQSDDNCKNKGVPSRPVHSAILFMAC
ncbi:hypothetical protein THAOC_31956 [Thalassiosira oceanica]|uniref:Phosphodiester glycosidase domain-containing protein n=1 Tax=Thalassiosira oceanica TaxID=159749 RepID=K0R748_THAOC|nr:hypothetical protein THAOC_31956 [Thalassiosira oceanica]|eukprot:EJK49198.1 hypothetical protein THAOC_31956 [Thalassiosira oceanica]